MKLSLATHGSGPRTTLLVHGFLGSGRNLAGLARQWSARAPERRFLLPDLTGHGNSAPLPPGATLDTLATDLLETMEGESGAVEIVGHSLGGRVALAAARICPWRFSRITLLDIAPGPIPRRISESARVLDALLAAPPTAADRETMRAALAAPGTLSPELVEWVLMNLKPGGDGYVWRIDARALAEAAPRLNVADLWDVVERRGPPMLAVRGLRSPYVDDTDAARLRAARVHVAQLPDAGHFVHVDSPVPLLELLCREEWA